MVRELGARGARVAAVDRDEGRLSGAGAESAASGEGVAFFPADVSSSTEVRGLVEEVESRLGPIDFLVNAAGVLRMGEVRRLTDEDWSTTFAVNAAGVFLVSRAVSDRMVSRGGGAIVTVSSNASTTPRADMGAYAASKAAATMITKTLGLEVAEHGVRCNVVAPGSTDTPMLSSMWEDSGGRDATIAGVPERYRVGIPLGKLATPEDVADAVAFLLGDEAAHITMHSLTVDGGAALGS